MFLEDQLQLEKKGISLEKIENQISWFKSGFPYMNIIRPAIISDGIIKYNNQILNEMANEYEKAVQKNIKIKKFVPASGAATRMFKDLYEFINQKKKDIFHTNFSKQFIDNLNKFPFSAELKKISKINDDNTIGINESIIIVEKLLNENGLNYGNLPKGVLEFHQSAKGIRTPIEEHMVEGALYVKDSSNHVNIHFTVSPEHENMFKRVVESARKRFEEEYDVKYVISFSHQKTSTDTLAVKPDNTPFRIESGELLFRPAGHGALIENLNDLKSDIVFIKNIDNVTQEHLIDDTVLYKKALAGTLCKTKDLIFRILELLEDASEIIIRDSIIPSLQAHNINIPETILMQHAKHLKDSLFGYLNRPIRVCGMVKNEGEPGGGPFWVEDKEGNIALQIVESSQIEMTNEKYKNIVNKSTHFNPVDLVCSLKNYKGEKFDLSLYVDPDTGFISEKSYVGSPIKALELPGLWNGAMAHWITIFVEVPLSTFNPVKTINDLLRPQHQPE
ncbi:MAG: DUF4301 family protein [Marinilabiliaceae bacterium]|nr:DUF4301 family protein [Marinilabiliaceae bacterium]